MTCRQQNTSTAGRYLIHSGTESQPVQFLKQLRHVVVLAGLANETCCCTGDRLQTVQRVLGNACCYSKLLVVILLVLAVLRYVTVGCWHGADCRLIMWKVSSVRRHTPSLLTAGLLNAPRTVRSTYSLCTLFTPTVCVQNVCIYSNQQHFCVLVCNTEIRHCYCDFVWLRNNTHVVVTASSQLL